MSDEQNKMAVLEQAVAELQRQVASLTAKLEQVSEKLKAEELPVTSVDFGHEDYLSDISFLSSEDKGADALAESAVTSVEEVPVKEASEKVPVDEPTAESVEETGGTPEGNVEAVSEEDKDGVTVEDSAELPEDESVEGSVEESANEPVEDSVDGQVEEPVEVSIDEPVEDSVEELSEEPVNEFVEVPVEDPLENPVDGQEAEPVGEPTAEDDLPEDDFPEDGFSLFGDLEPEETPEKTKTVKPARTRKADGAYKGKSPEWMTAMPGAAVKDIRSAISLNDRVMFISTLFREDSLLYQDVVSNINGMESFDTAVKYLSDTFPEWDKESESVYRFMMAVRRKLREA